MTSLLPLCPRLMLAVIQLEQSLWLRCGSVLALSAVGCVADPSWHALQLIRPGTLCSWLAADPSRHALQLFDARFSSLACSDHPSLAHYEVRFTL